MNFYVTLREPTNESNISGKKQHQTSYRSGAPRALGRRTLEALPPLLFILVLLLAGLPGRAAAAVIDPRLERALAAGASPLTVIVKLADSSATLRSKPLVPFSRGKLRAQFAESLRGAAAQTRKPLEDWLRARGAAPEPLWIVNGLSVSATPGQIRAMATFPGVTGIRLNATVAAPRPSLAAAAPRPSAATAAPLSTPIEWHVSGIKAPDMWAKGFTGASIVIGSLDTGVDYLHSDLSFRWRGGSNSWYDPYKQHATPYDITGHGTAVMGVLVGGAATGSSVGVAPGAKWISAKIFDDSGSGDFTAIHKSFQWMLDPDGIPGTDDAPDVVNNSWGLENMTDEYDNEFLPDVQALKAAGIGVTFAAGNGGPLASTSISPANYPGTLSVGDVDLLNAYVIAGTSSRGPGPAPFLALYPMVVAPGEGVRSCGVTGGGINLTQAVIGSGTSFSAPCVAGGLAILAQAFPKARMNVLEAAIAQSASDLGTPGIDNDTGYGIVDLISAYQLLSRKFKNGADSAWNAAE